MSNTKKRSKAGLVVLIILLIIIGIPVAIVMMLQPGTARWNRITGEKTVVSSEGIEISSTSIIFHEDWLEKNIAKGFQLFNEESTDFQIAGSDLTLEKNELSFLIGAALINPLSSKGKTINAAVEASISASISDTRELKLQLESIKIGRMPIPVKLLTKIQAVKSSLNTENLLKGKEAEFDLETMSFTVNLDDIMKDISPGSHIQNFQFLDEKISVSVSLSSELNREIKKLASELEDIVPDVHSAIIEKMPSPKTGGLEQASIIYQELAAQDNRESRATLSYVEGEISASSNGNERLLNFGDILDEGTILSTAKKSYAEIVLPGSSILKILEDSEVIIHSAAQEGMIEENRIELASGKIRAVVASLDNENDEFSVQAGLTTMEVRGTDFIVSYDGVVELTVLEGAVAIENKESMALVKENQTVSAKENKKPEPESLSDKAREKLQKQTQIFTDPATVDSLLGYNSAPPLLKLFTIYADLFLSLTPEEQEELELIVSEYIEEHPELMRDLVQFAEEQGWMEEEIDS